MSQFFWQNVVQEQQQPPDISHSEGTQDGSGWSNIGLTGGTESNQQLHASANGSLSFSNVDPYVAAVVHGYSSLPTFGHGHVHTAVSQQTQPNPKQYHPSLANNQYYPMTNGRNVQEQLGQLQDVGASSVQERRSSGHGLQGSSQSSNVRHLHSPSNFGTHQPILPAVHCGHTLHDKGNKEKLKGNSDIRGSASSNSSGGRNEEYDSSASTEAANRLCEMRHASNENVNVRAYSPDEGAEHLSESQLSNATVPDIINISEGHMRSAQKTTGKNVEKTAWVEHRESVTSNHSDQKLAKSRCEEGENRNVAADVTEPKDAAPEPMVQNTEGIGDTSSEAANSRINDAEAKKHAEQKEHEAAQLSISAASNLVCMAEKASDPSESPELSTPTAVTERERVHSPVAVAQVTPIISHVAGNFPTVGSVSSTQASSGPSASGSPHSTVQPAASSGPSASGSPHSTVQPAVLAANVARVDPIPSQPVDAFAPSFNRVAPSVQPQTATVQNSTPSVNIQTVDTVQAGGEAELATSDAASGGGVEENAASTQPQATASTDVAFTQHRDNPSQMTAGTVEALRSTAVESSSAALTLQEQVSEAPPASATLHNESSVNPLSQLPTERKTEITSFANAARATAHDDRTTDSTPQEENSSVAGSSSGRVASGQKKSVRDRYRSIRQQYPELMKRLDRHKNETPNILDWRTPPKNLLLLNANQSLDSSVAAIAKNSKSSTPKESSGEVTLFKHPDISAIEPLRPSSKMTHSYTISGHMDLDQSLREVDYYGDDFVNSYRRSRFARNRDQERAPSRGAKSEMGEIGPYRGSAASIHKHRMQQSMYAYDSLPYGYNMSGRRSVGPMYGYPAHDPYGMYSLDPLLHRRPQSSFDAVAFSRYEQAGSRYGAYDAYHSGRENEGSKHGESTESESGSGSDDEVAQIHYQQEMERRARAMQYGGGAVAVPDEFYYFGVIQLSQDRVQNIMYKYPPPPEYFHLPPIEKAAYLFFCALYRRHFRPVDVFHKRFNREFFNYTCDGDTPEIALWKICKHTQEEFNAKRSADQLKAYEMSRKQLFSDERETPSDSRLSDRGSRYDHEEDSDRLSVESALKEPLKFRSPHAFLRFGVGGKAIIVKPESSISVVEIKDVKNMATDHETKRIVDAIESFRGPLIAGYTPTHSVRLFVQRQIERILKSDVYRSDPSNGDANDCLLIWQLLEMVVQQQGRVTGPDISRLLMTSYAGSLRHAHHDGEESPSPTSVVDERKVDPYAHERFTNFLLGGHIDEAIESAVRDGLYSDAMVLARRVYAHDPRKLEKVETMFLSHRPEQNPVMTLLSVASDQPAPILTNPPTDDSGSWRSHAAIVLANLNSPMAFNTVYHLGRVLARRQYNAAADFCFLAVNLLAGYDPFQPVTYSDEENEPIRQHITLIHASPPDDDDGSGSAKCRFGFSLLDLHATEIFEYATKLANNGQPVQVSRSLAYQMCRLDYAELLSEYGSFSPDAFRYCVEVAKGIWERCMELDKEQLVRLYNLADRLQYVSLAEQADTLWLPSMRTVIEQYDSMVQSQMTQPHESIDNTENVIGNQNLHQNYSANYADQQIVPQKISEAVEKTRTMSLGSEAADWHAEHQEPLQMSPISSSLAPDFSRKDEQPIAPAAPPAQLSAPTAVHSSSDSHQHHILGQRRMSASNSVAGSTTSAAGAYKYAAFPPSLPQPSELQGPISKPKPTGDSRHGSICEQPAEEDKQNFNCLNEPDDLRHRVLGGVVRATPPSGSVTDGTTTTSNSIEGTPVRERGNVNFDVFAQDSSDYSTLLGVPSPEGMNDSVFTHGSDSFATPPAENRSTPQPSQQSSNELGAPAETTLPHSAPPVPKREEPKESSKPSVDGKSQSLSGKTHHSSGLFSILKAKIVKAIPSANEMILPDDTNPSIVWDPVLNKYVGAGVEEVKETAPPPSAASSSILNGSVHGSTGGLTAARLSGGSRYFNPLNEISPSPATSQSPVPVVPAMPLPTTFGFIPQMPDDDEGIADSPFSVDTSPAPPESAAATTQ